MATIIGENLKQLRQRAGMSVRKLAELSGVSKSVISEIENGCSQNPRFETVKNLAAALNTTPEQLEDMEYEHEYVLTDVKQALEIVLSQENLTLNGEPLKEEAKTQLINSIKMGLRFAEDIQKKG